MLWLYFYYIELFENGKENNDSYKESMGKNNGGEFVGGEGGQGNQSYIVKPPPSRCIC